METGSPAQREEPGLASWLAAHGARADTLTPLSGDVSVRRYQRVDLASGGTAVVATYPRVIRDACHRFLTSSRLLAAAAVPVPRILAHDCGRGWMLLADVGRQTLYDWEDRGWEALTPYFEAAVELARRVAALPAGEVAELNPPLNEDVLARELRQTREAFLEPRGLVGGAAAARRLEAALATLCRRLADDPPVPCHRDLMARNLVPGPAPGQLWVLDHQDLRLGPPAYDLASLLNDSLFPPPALEERLLERALPAPGDRLAYHRAAAQRTLKAVGTFATFAARGHPRHLPLIPPTLRRGLSHLAHLPETAEIAPELARRWAPAIC